MPYNFDQIIEREDTSCVKYDLREQIFGTKDVIPLWVADMDFQTPDFILQALRKRLDHEILGYSIRPENFDQSIINWMQKRHGWKIEKNWIDISPGVVPALSAAVLAYSNPGDEIIVQTPVYFPFFHAIKGNSRVQVHNPLRLTNGRYCMDLEDLKRKITGRTKMIFLCNPHNPGGSVWSKEELLSLASICIDHNILIISDEIHSDLVLYGNKHIPMASLGQEVSDRTVTLMSSSKTFNTAGLAMSINIVSSEKMRKRLNDIMSSFHLNLGNIPGFIAMEAAYEQGDKWVDELIGYLEMNIDYIEEYLSSHIPQITMVKPQGTYLVWLDFRKLGLENGQLTDLLINESHLGFSDGILFGEEGRGFYRFNIACPRATIEKALINLKGTIENLAAN